MGIDMLNHVDGPFVSTVGVRQQVTTGYADGIPTVTANAYLDGNPSHNVNIQPADDRLIDWLERGGQRVRDARRVWVNDGDLYSISPADDWTFEALPGAVYRSVKLDNRPWHNYCRIVVVIYDD